MHCRFGNQTSNQQSFDHYPEATQTEQIAEKESVVAQSRACCFCAWKSGQCKDEKCTHFFAIPPHDKTGTVVVKDAQDVNVCPLNT